MSGVVALHLISILALLTDAGFLIRRRGRGWWREVCMSALMLVPMIDVAADTGLLPSTVWAAALIAGALAFAPFQAARRDRRTAPSIVLGQCLHSPLMLVVAATLVVAMDHSAVGSVSGSHGHGASSVPLSSAALVLSGLLLGALVHTILKARASEAFSRLWMTASMAAMAAASAVAPW